MANATTTIAGDVQLAGDIGGNNNAASPALTNTAVTAGSYTVPNFTVDSKGRITAASNGVSTLSGDVTGPFTATVLSNTGVSAGTYTLANFTVDSKGRITAASSGSYTLPNATTTTKGGVQIGSNIYVNAGVISVELASGSTSYGVVKSANTANITITSGSIDVGTNIAKLNANNTFTKSQYNQPYALTSGASVAVDGSQSNVYTLTLGTNATLANPTSLGAGRYTFIIKQDATGSRTLAFGTNYKFPTGSDTTISTPANSVNVLTCTSNGTYLYCSLAKNFA